MKNLVNTFTCELLVHQINMPILNLPDNFKKDIYCQFVLLIYSEIKYPD